MPLFRTLALALLLGGLGGCGTTVPHIDHEDPTPDRGAILITNVSGQIHCQLRDAVITTYDRLREPKGLADPSWMKTWSAKVSLTLNIDERSALSPGLTLTRLVPALKTVLGNGDLIVSPRSFSLGLGGSLASTASRQVEISWFEIFGELLSERAFVGRCPQAKAGFIEGDLGIYETLFAGAYPGSLSSNMANPFKSGGRLDTIQHTAAFFVEAGGNATPTWRFVEIAANTGGDPLFDVSRKRRDTVLVTMGPSMVEDTKRPLRERIRPSPSVEGTHHAKQNAIGIVNSLTGLR